MKRTRLMAFLAVLAGTGLARADEWYVDASAAADGNGTQARPYQTIQDAVTAAGEGDTVYVAAGLYTNGCTDVSGTGNRVVIDGKPGLRLIGAGRGKSVIAGSRDPNAADAFVEKETPVRGIRVVDSDGAVISGFTIRDGEVSYEGSTITAANGGAGVMADSTAVTFVDCEIRHCAGWYGPVSSGTFVRCFIDDNYAKTGPGGYRARLVNCAVSRARPSGGSTGTFYACELYNVTAADNDTVWAMHGNCHAWNSIFVTCSSYQIDYRETNTLNDVVTDCVLGSQASKGQIQLIGPAVGDFRPVAGSDAVGAGDPAHLASLSLPEGVDAFTDLSGAKIVADASGRITAGAYQTPVTPAGGALHFTCLIEVNGRVSKNPKINWVYPDAYPTQYCVKAVLKDGEHLYRMERLDPSTGAASTDFPSFVPARDGTMWMMPPVDPAMTVTNATAVAKTVKWVDPKNGSDTADGSESTPYATIQKAYSSQSGNTVIYLKPGVYTNDVQVDSTRGRFRAVLSTTNAKVRLVSTDGAENTVIRGAPDPEGPKEGDEAGLGANAVKGVCATGANLILQGITVADCYTYGLADVASSSALLYGAAIYVYGTAAQAPQVVDCVVTNCHAVRGVETGSALFRRCRFYDSTSTINSPLNGGTFFGCYARNVECTVSGSGATGTYGNSARVYQSTTTGTLGEGRLTGNGNISYNSIWYGGLNIYSTSVYTNCIVYNPKGDVAGGIFWKIDPLLADVARTGTLRKGTPAVGLGAELTADGIGADYWKYAAGDVNNDPIVFTDGKATLGAFQNPIALTIVTVAAPAQGGWKLAAGSDYGVVKIFEGETLELKVEPATSTRPCIGVTVAGRRYLFSGKAGGTLDIRLTSDDLAGVADTAVEGIYTADWYVSESGDDAACGFWAEAAKKTLPTAAALLTAGDTLHVLPGVYADEPVFHTAKATIRSRVVVKANTTVVSTEGPEKTFIVGADATEDVDPETGCGTNAVRCAYVESGGTLSGFTLTRGRVNLKTTANAAPYDGYGPAVLGAGRGACAIVDCIVSNHYAYLGTVALCDAVRCRIVDNKVAGHGSGVRQGNVYGCYIDRCQGTSCISYGSKVWNSTIGRGNNRAEGSVQPGSGFSNGVKGFDIRNTYFGGPINASSATDIGTISNTVVQASSTTIAEGNVTNDLYLVTTADDRFEDGVPVIGANAAVDRGCTALYDAELLGETDLNGNPRVMNGRMDIGCFEADWRPRYAADIWSARNLKVTAVSPEVYESDDRQVALPSGTLVAEVYGTAGVELTRRVTVAAEGGTLTVSLNGEVLDTVTDDERTIRFTSDRATDELTFGFVPAAEEPGEARIVSVRKDTGLMLIVR